MPSKIERPVVLFLHIPKCAGHTVYSIIHEQCRPGSVFIPYKSASDNWKALEATTEESRKQIVAVAAHMRYGAHKFFCKSEYFTILRDPVSRVVSSYHYSLGNPNDFGHQLIKDGELTLADFAQLPQLNNLQTNYLARQTTKELGWEFNPRKFGYLSGRVALFNACMRLRRFAVTGILEDFPRVLELLEKRFGWKNIKNRVENASTAGYSHPHIDDVTRKIIENENQLDMALYRYAKIIFSRQCKKHGVT